MPVVSVIMNCYNSEKYLKEALDSVFNQTFNDFEIIFWDNQSTDQSASTAKSYGEKLRYFHGKTFLPLGEARNEALKMARGKFIAFLDCDDAWMPTKLEKQVALFEKNPSVGLIFCDAVYYYQYNGASRRLFASKESQPLRGRIFSHLLTNYNLPVPTVMVRAEALHAQPEWFDKRFKTCEDFDLFLRIAHDWDCDYVDEPLAMYRVHSASTSEALNEYFPIEVDLTFEKFVRYYPGFEKDYQPEIKIAKRHNALRKGISLWRQGFGRQARGEFKHYLNHPKFLIIYLASILPYLYVKKLIVALKLKV